MQGQKVSKGQLLFTLENPEYIIVQQEYLETQNQLNYLKTDYERQADLFKDNVTSQKIFLKAETDYKVTLTRNESLKKKLQLMNINPANVSATNLKSTIAVTSPIEGYVTNIAVSQGMFLNPSDIAITLINTDHLLMELTIFEQDLAHISVGQEVTFSVQSGSEKYMANVYLINKEIDPIKRTIGVYCQLSNKDGEKLTPGMFVEAEIYTTVDSTFALPIQAISSIDNKDYILIKADQNDNGMEFEKKEVTIGIGDDKYVQILNFNDFTVGTEVLTKGAFNLINE
jgi:cobalt-zinc-cadmium efflux system membrane fusion protein